MKFLSNSAHLAVALAVNSKQQFNLIQQLSNWQRRSTNPTCIEHSSSIWPIEPWRPSSSHRWSAMTAFRRSKRDNAYSWSCLCYDQHNCYDFTAKCMNTCNCKRHTFMFFAVASIYVKRNVFGYLHVVIRFLRCLTIWPLGEARIISPKWAMRRIQQTWLSYRRRQMWFTMSMLLVTSFYFMQSTKSSMIFPCCMLFLWPLLPTPLSLLTTFCERRRRKTTCERSARLKRFLTILMFSQ